MINKSLKLINIGNLVSYNSKKEAMVSKKDLEVVIKNGKIIEIGRCLNDADEIYDCENKLVTPGFIDCHTHPVFLEDRSKEGTDNFVKVYEVIPSQYAELIIP